MNFFSQNNNTYILNYANFLIDIFKKLKDIDFEVKSVVLDHYNVFLDNNRKKSIQNIYHNSGKKRAVTPHLIASVFDDKYEWNIKIVSSPSSDYDKQRKQFFSKNKDGKKKKKSFDLKIKSNSLRTNENRESPNKEIKGKSFIQIQNNLKRRKIIIENIKKTQKFLNEYKNKLTQEIIDLKGDIKTNLSLFQNKNIDRKEASIEDKSKDNEDSSIVSHQKTSSKVNKLSFGQKAFSYEKLDPTTRSSAISPKFESNDNNNRNFLSALENLTSAQIIKDNTPKNLESDSSFFEESKPILKNSLILFKEKYEEISRRAYKDKPQSKIRVGIFFLYWINKFLARRSAIYLL